MDLDAQLDHFVALFALFSALALALGGLGVLVRRHSDAPRPLWLALAGRALEFINPQRDQFRGDGAGGETAGAFDNIGQITIATLVLLATAAALLEYF